MSQMISSMGIPLNPPIIKMLQGTFLIDGNAGTYKVIMHPGHVRGVLLRRRPPAWWASSAT